MKRLFSRLVAMFRRGTSRPVLQFRLPDGRIDNDALTKHIIDFWKRHREEVGYQLAGLMATLRLAVPGLVNISWAYDQEYGDDGYFEVTRDIELHVRLPDGRQMTLGLPEYSDLHCEEFSYWSAGDDLYAAVDEALEEGETIDDEERDRRFFQRLASQFGLTGVSDDEALRQLGTLVASVIDFTRTLDTYLTAVPEEVMAMLPPLPPPPELPSVAGQGTRDPAEPSTPVEPHAQAA